MLQTPTLDFIADFGDIAALLPATLAVCIVLLLQRNIRYALAWAAAFAVCVSLILLLKLAIGIMTVAIFDQEVQVGAPSGHAALSTVFYGGLAAMLLNRAKGGRFAGWANLAVGLLLGVAVSIIFAVWMLEWHSVIDLASGAILGAGCAMVARVMSRREIPSSSAAMVAVVAASAVVSLLHGARFDDSTFSAQYHSIMSGAVEQSTEHRSTPRQQSIALPIPERP